VAVELSFREGNEHSLKLPSDLMLESGPEELRSVLLGNSALAKEKYDWIPSVISSVSENDLAESVCLKAKSFL
jgi:hypothetical protein